MPRAAVSAAVDARLGALWSGAAYIAGNTDGEPPADGSDFLIVQYPVASTERTQLGARTYREEGALRFVLHMQRGFGFAAVLAAADTLADLFRHVTFDGVEALASVSATLDDGNEDGNYIRAAVVVPYRFDFVA